MRIQPALAIHAHPSSISISVCVWFRTGEDVYRAELCGTGTVGGSGRGWNGGVVWWVNDRRRRNRDRGHRLRPKHSAARFEQTVDVRNEDRECGDE